MKMEQTSLISLYPTRDSRSTPSPILSPSLSVEARFNSETRRRSRRSSKQKAEDDVINSDIDDYLINDHFSDSLDLSPHVCRNPATVFPT